jgi:hypothetical protein
MRSLAVAILAPFGLLALAACDAGSKAAPPAAAKPASPEATISAKPVATAPAAEGALRLGAAIEASAQKVALAEVAKRPADFVGKTFATTGTVTQVCQHRGCWMEIKDDASEAHVKMAGHAFFVPKTASGKKARVLAKLEGEDGGGACGGEGHEGMAAAHAGEKSGCRVEAEKQLGHPLAKLELVAEGVELM